MDSRPPPPQGAPPTYAFVTRVYKRNLRPVVLAVAFWAGLWALFSAIGSFRNAALDRLGDVSKFRIIYIVVGSLFMLVACFEGFGIFAAAKERLPLVRSYAYLSAVSTLIVIGIGLLRIIIHFTMKNEIISTCNTLLTQEGAVVYFGFWGPVYRDLSPGEAEDWCRRGWEHDSWEDIVSFLVTSVLAFFFSAIAFAYFRQALDPSSPANASRMRNANPPPSHYNPPYSVPNLPYEQPGYDRYGGDPSALPPYEYNPGYSGADDKKDDKNPFDDHGSSSRA